ncbi:MAG: hypothetical protein HKN32_09970, partial [Flavobacteriales bacterium]|nr:hypothetical protein [Flavobacteriales bacterium]
MGKLDFTEFNSFSIDEWRTLASKELKNRPLSEIEWNFGDESFEPFQHALSPTSEFSISKPALGWKIRQDISSQSTRGNAQKVIDGGVDLLGVPSSALTILDGLDLPEDTKLILKGTVDQKSLIKLEDIFGETWKKRIAGVDLDVWSFEQLDQEVEKEAIGILLTTFGNDYVPRFTINTVALRNQGATLEQELVFGLCAGHEFLLMLLENGYSLDQASAMIHFKIGTGSEYYLELVKPRVLRQLWGVIIKEYAPDHACSVNTSITAETTKWNKPAVDVK